MLRNTYVYRIAIDCGMEDQKSSNCIWEFSQYSICYHLSDITGTTNYMDIVITADIDVDPDEILFTTLKTLKRSISRSYIEKVSEF